MYQVKWELMYCLTVYGHKVENDRDSRIWMSCETLRRTKAQSC